MARGAGKATRSARRRPRSAPRLLLAASALALGGCTALPLGRGAPLPLPAPLLARSDSLAAAGDTTAALALLAAVVRDEPRAAAAWHQRGLLAARYGGVGRRDGGPPARAPLRAVADSSLRRAAALAPDSARYLLSLGRYHLSSELSHVRRRARERFERAAALARRGGDRRVLSEAQDELAMLVWRRYEDLADRMIYSETADGPRDPALIFDRRALDYFVENADVRAAAQDWSGQPLWIETWHALTHALRTDPENARARRHLYMLLVERQQWEELREHARARLLGAPGDAWSWLALGLASHRLRDGHAATAAFDSALMRLPAAEREHLSRLSRVLSPADSADHHALARPERQTAERIYWIMADPLWLSPANEHRNEFLSRVVYAELRWSVDEFWVRGADSDRGTMLVRYGPPPAVISFPPDPMARRENRVQILWWYRDSTAFVFRQPRGFGLASLDPQDERRLRTLRERTPVVWANLTVERGLDTIAVRAARFRAPGDSSDVLLAAQVPAEALVRDIDLADGVLEVGFHAYNWGAQRVVAQADREVVPFQRSGAQHRDWRARLAAGAYLYRVEAYQPDAQRGARGAGVLEIVPDSGYGMSDLVLAARVVPRSALAERWTDFVITPSLGTIRREDGLALLWETYELAARDERSRYRVTITLAPAPGTALGRLAATIVGGVRSAIGRSGSGSGRVSLTYERQVPARPAAVDYLALDLRAVQRGAYTLDVMVTDLATNRRTTRTAAFTLVE